MLNPWESKPDSTEPFKTNSIQPGKSLYFSIAFRYGAMLGLTSGAGLFGASIENIFIAVAGFIWFIILLVGGVVETSHQMEMFYALVVPQAVQPQAPIVQEIHNHYHTADDNRETVKHFDNSDDRPSQEFLEVVCQGIGKTQIQSERQFADMFPGKPTNKWLSLLESDGWIEKTRPSERGNSPRRVVEGSGITSERILSDYGYSNLSPTA